MQKKVWTLENTQPLSFSQANIWSLEQSFPGTPMNNICATMRIRGRFDIALIQKSLSMVIEADSSLRTRIVFVDDVPRQYCAEYAEIPAPFFDFTMTNQNGFHQWEAAVTRDLMPLIDSPLYYFAIFKLGENDGGLLIKTHHLISDGWSQVLIGNRFSELYLKLLSASPEQYAEITIDSAPSYIGHIKTEQKYLSSSAYQRDCDFWNKKLEDRPEPATIKNCLSASVSPVGQRKTFELSELLNHAIFRFCSTYRVAPFSVIYMALAIYLNRISGKDRLCIGVPIFNRTNYTEKLTTGMFVSTLPFINRMDENWSFAEFNQRLTEQWFTLLKHQRYPFFEMMELAKRYHPEQSKLFHIVLSYQNSKMTASDNASVSFSGDWHYSGYQAEHLCIHLSHLEDEHRYSISYDYLSQIFCEQEIEDLHHYLVNILSEALGNPDRPIWQYSVIGDAEKEQVLFRFNQTNVPRYKESLCRQWDDVVERYKSRVALIHNGERMTYGELSLRADKIASILLSRFPKEKVVAALLLPKDFSLFEAMAGVLQSGNAWVILPQDIPAGRLDEILKDSGAAAVITTRDLQAVYSLPDERCVFADDCAFFSNTENPARRPSELCDLAYIVYTSGSTGKPKGVEIEQGNLLNFALSMSRYYGHGAVLSLCNTGFDAFMLESAASLLNGRTIVLPTKEEQESPAKLAKLIRGYAVGFMALTPSRLAAFLRNGEFLLAISKLDSIVCGGETFPGDLLQLLKRYTHADIYNQYGPSETTIGVSMKRLNDASAITIGRPMENCRIYLLDHHLSPLPIGAFGDLYVGGACVGRGYRNLAETTQKAFLDSPFELGERIYKTGDIGRWTPDGEIILGGRKDQQVKIRGLRIEPQEITSRLSMHPQVREAAVRILKINEQPLIVAYYTVVGAVSEMQLLEFCANYLPSYMIPAFLVQVEEIPLTLNGKADLDKLPLPEIHRGNSRPETEIQKTIVALFRRVLKREDITPQSDYFLNGGDSLNALEVLTELEHEFGISLRIADMYACRTASRLEERICEAKGLPTPPLSGGHPLLKKADARESYPLTSIQQSLYFQAQLDPTGLSYNMPGAFRLPETVDLKELETSLKLLVEQEPMLRAYFVLEKKRIVQKIRSDAELSIERIEAPDFSQACEQFVRPFHLEEAPLFRAAFWKEDQKTTVLFIDLHHIICDGISSSLLLKRLNAIYCGEPLCVDYHYLDYACFKENEEANPGKETLAFWEKNISLIEEPFLLPTDQLRPRRFDYLGLKKGFCLSAEQSAACDAYCEANGLSAYMLFVGVWGILLSKAAGNFDFLIGTPVSGRNRREFWDIFGAFINTLPLRLTPSRNITAADYLKTVREQVVGMLDHQDITAEELLEITGTERSLDKNSLYSVLFSMSPVNTEDFSLDGKPLAYLPVPTGTAKLDLNLEVSKECGCYSFSLEYASSLFNSSTIALFCRSYRKLLDGILENDQTLLYDLPVLSAKDKRELIDIPNHTFTPYLNLSIDELIDGNAEAEPSEPAVIFHDEILTYRDLKAKSDALAGLLQENGVVRGDAVAFCLKRSADIPVAMLAINKAGAAYIPTVDTLPKERLEYMLKNSGAKLVLCDEATKSELEGVSSCPILPVLYDHLPLQPVSGRSASDIMHILYTSGSTGRPKGVQIRHSNLSNLLPSIDEMTRDIKGNFLCIANAIFDTFITETLYQLALGRTIIMADEEEMMLPWKMAELIERHDVTMLQFTPSRLQMCLGNEAFVSAMKKIKLIIVCGEVFRPQLLEQLQGIGDMKIITMYGPTEVTVYMTMADVSHADHITIGKPMHNSRVYALDENRRPVMPTAWGELYIAGECVSAGYINRPDLTSASYLPDPFFPGQIMYRSGDIGRLRTDGYYDFGGRKDNQVKLNGQRIELDEITGQLLTCPGIREAATVAVKKADSSMMLRGFFVSDQNPDPAEMKRRLSKTLPAYMIPTVLTKLEELPKTPSGKTDLLRLAAWEDEENVRGKTDLPCEGKSEDKESATSVLTSPFEEKPVLPQKQPIASVVVDLSEESAMSDTSEVQNTDDSGREAVSVSVRLEEVHTESEEVARTRTPEKGFAEIREEDSSIAQDVQNELLSLWKTVLERNNISSDKSFFEQGGTSLAALNMLSFYFNRGWAMTLEQFYDHPTIQEQAELIQEMLPKKEKPEISTMISDDVLPVQTRISVKNGHEEVGENPVSNPEKEKDHAGPVILLTGATGFLGSHLVKALLEGGVSRVICPIRGDHPDRLYQSLADYFDVSWVKEHQSFLQPVCGDIEKPFFGLNPVEFPKIQYVLHAAADVRHYVSDDSSLETNVKGTRNAIDLAKELGATLLHISTISVCGEYLLDKPNLRCIYAENDRDIGQNWRENSYVRGKFMAEQTVFEAMEHGLEAKIFRIGRLVGRSTDGVFQKNPQKNTFYSLMRGLMLLDYYPASLEALPIELSAVDECARAIVSLIHAQLPVCHVFNPHTIPLGRLAKEFNRRIMPVGDKEFEEYISLLLSRGYAPRLATLLDFWNRLQRHSMLIYPSAVRTVSELEAHSFEWKNPDPAVLLQSFLQ